MLKKPTNNYTRGYYSPNTELYELGYRGGYGRRSIPIIYLKLSKATALSFARAQKAYAINKLAIALVVNIVNEIFLINFVRQSYINTISLIQTSRLINRGKVTIANTIRLVNITRTTFVKKVSQIIEIVILQAKRTTVSLKSSLILQVQLTNIHKGIIYIVRSIAKQIQLVNDSKQMAIVRRGIATVNNRAVNFRVVFLNKLSSVIELTIPFEGSVRLRILRATTVAVSFAKSSRNVFYQRLSQANLIGQANSSRTVAAIKNSITQSVILSSTVRTVALNKVGRALLISLAQVYKGINRAKNTTVLLILFAKNSRTLHYLVNSRVIAIFRASTVYNLAIVRIAKAIVIGISTARRTVSLNKLGRALYVPIGGLFRGINRPKKVVVLEAAAATVTKNIQFGRGASATIVYRIGTSQNFTRARRAIATMVSMARFGIKAAVMNIRAIANEDKIESEIQTNYYVIPANPGPGPVPGNETEIFDNVPEDYNEQDDAIGDSQIPDPNYNN